MVVLDPPAEIVLASVDDDGAMVYSIDLLADEHHAHGFCHPVCYVVKGENHFLGHLPIFYLNII